MSASPLPLPRFDKPVKLLAVVAPFHKDITDALLFGAQGVAAAAGATLEVIEVPGAFEIPSAIGIADRMAEFDGFVALGCVVGKQDGVHQACNHALSLIGLQGVALGHGVLNVDDIAAGNAASDPKGANKGGQAAAAALHLIALSRKWASDTKGIGFRP